MNYRIQPLIAAVIVVTVPLLAQAQGAVNAKGTEVSLVPCKGVDCNLSSFATLVQNLLNFGIFLASIIAALLFAYAGWLYLSNSLNGGESVSRAKSLFINVAIGYVIILGAWLVVDTLLGSLLGSDFGLWNALS
jgi:hypothetical protein